MVGIEGVVGFIRRDIAFRSLGCFQGRSQLEFARLFEDMVHWGYTVVLWSLRIRIPSPFEATRSGLHSRFCPVYVHVCGMSSSLAHSSFPIQPPGAPRLTTGIGTCIHGPRSCSGSPPGSREGVFGVVGIERG
jgi:hypothetical protein